MNTRSMEVGGGSHEYQTYGGGGGVMHTRHMEMGGGSHEYQTYGGGEES